MKKILIVDDRAEVRELVEITLTGDDYKILKAKSGEEAIEVAKADKPDLILMDIMMPGEIDGLHSEVSLLGLSTLPSLSYRLRRLADRIGIGRLLPASQSSLEFGT